MDFKDHCLTCLSSGKEMRHCHTLISISEEDISLSDILLKFYNYEISSENQYPENICINCVHQLTITYSFKILIENSAKQLREAIITTDSVSEISNGNFETEEHKSPTKKKIYHTKKWQRRKTKNDMLLQDIIPGITSIFCVECKSQFNSMKSLNEHCNINHPVKSTVGRDCEYCNEKFEDFRSLVLHRKLHLKPYLCENCWDGFFDINNLNSHTCQPNLNKKEKKKSEKLLRQCDQCGKSYPPGYINVHMLTHSNDCRYTCKYCPKKFKVPGGLHSHILWNHKRTRDHKCEVCNATFISSSSRSSHIRKNHLKEKKYSCDNCGKRFFSKSELQRHSLTHTGVKNFHCHLCDKSYQTRYGLNVHLKSHAPVSNLNNMELQ